MKNTKRERKGFTLLEILLVIAAIGILAAIVLVAINPTRQIAQVRNAQRRSDINTIYKALEQYLIDNKDYPIGIDGTKRDVCINGNTSNCVNLGVLVPTYLSSIPTDPSGGAYKVYKNSENNRIGVEAPGVELGQSIAVNPISTPTPAVTATGGDITTINQNGTWYKVHTFLTSGTFEVTGGSLNVEYLVVGGGGGGGYGSDGGDGAGGGGAGGLLQGTTTVMNQSYPITIGSGGTSASSGGNSEFAGIIAIGGGRGAFGTTAPGAAGSGGSGGGGNYSNPVGGAGTSGPPKQGNNGGTGRVDGGGDTKGGGGGGAGDTGGNATLTVGGFGGAGISISINGTSSFYAAGGGGGNQRTGATTTATGGSGIGGNGALAQGNVSPTNGAPNTGSGGGGSSNTNTASGGNGGSGIVIVRYQIPAPTIVQNGLVLHLDAGNTSSYSGIGTTWTDLSGNGNNGTLVNGVGFSGSNDSLSFDGTNDFVEYSFTSPFAETVIVWVKSAGNNWNTDGWISASRNSNGHHIHPSANTKRMEYYVANSAGDGSVFIGSYTPVVEITTPHMYSYTTNGSNLHKGYFDGTEVVSSSASITRTTSPNAVTQYLGKDSILTRYGNGNIYIVLRYNRALTAEEIQQNYNALKGSFRL